MGNLKQFIIPLLITSCSLAYADLGVKRASTGGGGGTGAAGPAGAGGSSALEVLIPGVVTSSPTSTIKFDSNTFSGSVLSGTFSFVTKLTTFTLLGPNPGAQFIGAGSLGASVMASSIAANIVSSNSIAAGTIGSAQVQTSVFLSSNASGATSGAYTNANITVDVNGRVTSVANGIANAAGSAGDSITSSTMARVVGNTAGTNQNGISFQVKNATVGYFDGTGNLVLIYGLIASSISATGPPGYVVSQTTQVGFSFNVSPGATFYVHASSIVRTGYTEYGSSGTWTGTLTSTSDIIIGSTGKFRGDGSALTGIVSGGSGSTLEVFAPGIITSSPTNTVRIDTTTLVEGVSGTTATIGVNSQMLFPEPYGANIYAASFSSTVFSTPAAFGYGMPVFSHLDSTGTAVGYRIQIDSRSISAYDPWCLIVVESSGTHPDPVWIGVAVGTPGASGTGLTAVNYTSSQTLICSSITAGIAGRMFSSGYFRLTGAGQFAGSVNGEVDIRAARQSNTGGSGQVTIRSITLWWDRRMR